LYNPASGAFTPTGAMKVNRSHHTATLLGDGRVLITGGQDTSGNVLDSVEIYNPVTGTFVLTGALLFPRQYHTATLLPNGTVLVTGGKNGAGAYLKAAETYSPVSGHFSSTAAMSFARANHIATLLPNGTVLVAGGSTSGGVTTTGSLAQGRAGAAASLLLAGRVLISGGYAYCPAYDPIPSGMACIDEALTTAEIFNPSTGKFAKTGSMGTPRGAATLALTSVLLADGRVLIPGGGLHSGATLVSAEAFRPLTGKFSPVAPMHFRRVGHTVTMLPSGKVLVTGGYDGNAGTTLSSAELFTL
jgi:WD40 repeat protein